jgi:hypothetical protein
MIRSNTIFNLLNPHLFSHIIQSMQDIQMYQTMNTFPVEVLQQAQSSSFHAYDCAFAHEENTWNLH